MTLRRLVLGLALAAIAEIGVFCWTYEDLLYLHHSTNRILTDGRGTFVAQAERALSRKELTTDHLERIVQSAQRFSQSDLEIRALERLAKAQPADVQVRLRLADALRRAGQLDRAERVYRDLLTSDQGTM